MTKIPLRTGQTFHVPWDSGYDCDLWLIIDDGLAVMMDGHGDDDVAVRTPAQFREEFVDLHLVGDDCSRAGAWEWVT